jgi:hypothetical protein
MDIKDTLLKSLQSKMPRDTDSLKDMNNFATKLKTESEEFDEATGSGSAGGYVGPLSEEEYCDVCDKTKSECSCDEIKKVEATEATGSSSSGSYEGPSFLAKSQKKKDWRGAAKPLYKGGKFVKIKKKCQKFPYCNQGDINSLKLYENKLVKQSIQNLSKKMGINENVIKAIIQHELEEMMIKRQK